MREIVEMFAVSLALTLIIEFLVFLCFGQRSRRCLKLLLLVNLLTNPAAVLLHWLGIPQMPIEISVVLAEWQIYRQFSEDFSHPFALSLTANGVSWGLGLLIQFL